TVRAKPPQPRQALNDVRAQEVVALIGAEWRSDAIVKLIDRLSGTPALLIWEHAFQIHSEEEGIPLRLAVPKRALETIYLQVEPSMNGRRYAGELPAGLLPTDRR